MKKTLLVLAAFAFGATISVGTYAAGAAPAAQPQTLAQKHGPAWPKSVDGYVTKQQCLQCHGPYDKLAQTTAKLEPNPHFSHLGQVNCEDCHKADAAKPQLMCNQCHQFTLREKQAAAK